MSGFIQNVAVANYLPLLTEGKSWDAFRWDNNECIITPYCDGKRYWADGDTLIEGIFYKKMWAAEIVSTQLPVFQPPYDFSGNIFLAGFMREDTMTKQVFSRRIESGGQEYLTYDFSLEIGDSLLVDYVQDTYVYLDTILEITTLNGDNSRLFKFSGWPFTITELEYIEGVGGMENPLFPFGPFFEAGEDLQCVHLNGEDYYDFGGCLYMPPPLPQELAYAPLTGQNIAWRETEVHGDMGQTVYYSHHYYYLAGDTVINDQSYSLLFRGDYPFAVQGEALAGSFEGYIYEVDKRVFYAPDGDLEVQGLVYDFNLGVGDSLFLDVNILPWTISPVLITGVDIIQLENGEFRRKYLINYSTNYNFIIEGIGNGRGGLLYPEGGSTLDHINSLHCVASEDELLYSNNWINNGGDCLDITVSNEDIQFEEFYIYPNPVSSALFFSKHLELVDIKVFTLLGQLAKSYVGFSGQQIEVGELPRGVYVVVIQGEVDYVRKIVKE